MTRPPIRVERKGWSKWFHPTQVDLEAAVAWAEADANQYRFKNIEAVQDRVGYLIRQQLQTDVRIDIDGEHIESGAQLVSVWTGKIGPAYARIAVSQIGNEPANAMEAGAIAVRNAVERVANEVRQAAAELSKPELQLTERVRVQGHESAPSPTTKAQVTVPAGGAPRVHASKPGVKARLDARSKPAPPRTQR